MKKKLLTLLAFFLSLNFIIAQQTGIFETYIFFSKNGSDDNYKGSGGVGTTYNGASLGNVSSLLLKGAEIKTFKNNGGNVTGAGLQYKIYKQGSVSGSFIFLNIPFGTNIGVSGDQSWFTNSQTINLFSSVTSNGTWVVEIYWEAYTSLGNRTENCGGGNCIATFSVTTLSAELSAFSAQKFNNSIALSWLTSSEQNNSHFNVERSSNGKSFTTIGQVKSSGTSASSNKYNFTDNNPLSGVNYYRLNVVETTGKMVLSKVVTVDFSTKGSQKLMAYPNPTKSALDINYESNEDVSLNIQVLDMTGKVHLTKQIEGLKGDNNIRLDIENLPNGAYFMHVNDSMVKFFKM